MTATLAQLGARALRKLGIAIISDAERPGGAPAATADAAAALVLRELGIIVPEDERAAIAVPVSASELAQQTVRAVGGNPIAGTGSFGSVSNIEVADRALLSLGINPAGIGTVSPSELQTLTLETLATRALVKLTVYASDETPSAPDQALALAKVRAAHEALVALDYATWPASAVPERVAEQYTTMAANLMAPDFNKVGSAEAYQLAQEMIRQQALSGLGARTRAVARLFAIHGEMSAAGLADWPADAIPIDAAEPYVALLAQSLAPVHGKPQDAGVSAAAEARLRRSALSGVRGEALALAKVRAVHDRLISAGLASWPLTAVPQAYAEEYVTMASAAMSIVVGRDVDPAARTASAALADAAEARIRRGQMIRGAKSRALSKIQAVQSELGAVGLADWEANAIPAAVLDGIVAMAAEQLGPQFGKDSDPKAYAMAEARVRRAVMGGPRGQALAEQKVRAVHESLEARGRARWTLYDVPPFAEEPIVFMAATWLAPEVGEQADPAWWSAAEADLIRIVSLPSLRQPVQVDYF